MNEKNTQLIPLILCGGAGSRLWPLSRKTMPKACMPFIDGCPLVEQAYQRACAVAPKEQVHLATQKHLEPWFKRQSAFAELSNFIFEPMMMNTAGSVLLSVFALEQKYGEKATILVLPADHLISPLGVFKKAVDQAVSVAQTGLLITLGLKVQNASTDFGYIKTAEPLAEGVWGVDSFIEKPGQALAQKFFEADNYYWNSGMFCFQISTILNAYQQHCPKLYEKALVCWQKTSKEWPIKLSPQKLPNTSLDYAVMEKAKNIAVIPTSFDWQDIGSWQAYGKLWPKDTNQNHTIGNALLEDVHNSIIYSPDKLVAAVGLKDLVVINTQDALLVLPKDRLKDIKQIYAKLAENNPDLQ